MHRLPGQPKRLLAPSAVEQNLAIQRAAIAPAPDIAPPVVHDVLSSPGQPLDAQTRAFMEPRFGHDFSAVRVHSDGRAAESARAVSAHAYTVGNHVAFGEGKYQPGSEVGRRLLAHELAHVVQQGDASLPSRTHMPIGPVNDVAEAEARQAARMLLGTSVQPVKESAAVVRREETNESPLIEGHDPGFLVCLALCELGIPPAVWRTITRSFLEAVWEEFRQHYGEAKASSEFQAFQTAFKLYSPLRTMKTVLVFLTEGKIGFITVRSTGAQALRRRLVERLIARGATEAGIRTAAQIVRRVAVAIEVAIAAGCTLYCGAEAYARTIVEVIDAVAEGIAEAANVLSAVGQAGQSLLSQVFLRPVLVAHATVDPENWILDQLPGSLGTDLRVLSAYLWYRLEPQNHDLFVANITRPLNSYSVPYALAQSISAGISQVSSARTGMDITFTADHVLSLTPLAFAQMLHDWRVLRFRKDPERIADEALGMTEPLE